MDPYRLKKSKEEVFEAARKVALNSDNVDHIWNYNADEYEIGMVRSESHELVENVPKGFFTLIKVMDNDEAWDYYRDGWTGFIMLPVLYFKYKNRKTDGCYMLVKQWRGDKYRQEICTEIYEELGLDEKYIKALGPEGKAKGTFKDLVKCCFGLVFIFFMYALGGAIARLLTGNL